MVRFLLIVSITFLVNFTSAAQNRESKKDSLSKVGFKTDLDPVGLYVIDGLKLSKEIHDSLGVSIVTNKHVRIKGLDSLEAVKRFGDAGRDGVFLMETPLAFILSGKLLATRDEKKAALDQVNEKDIVEFRIINSEELFALHKYKNKFGAFVVTLK